MATCDTRVIIMKKEKAEELESRRDFLCKSALVGAAVCVGGGVVGNTQAQSTRINVRNPPYNAQGDGVTNDTAAFRNAIGDLPLNGTLVVPAGTYMLNADPEWCVRLRSNRKVELQANAKLKAIPNNLERHYLLWIDDKENVEIYGLGTGAQMAEIIGERDQHDGSTGEHGQGIRIVGSSNITVRNVRISKFWGDGITVARKDGKNSSDVSILGVICTHNRRQGMSIIGVDGMEVSDSEFSNTSGAEPEDGIDIEPDSGGSVSGVLIRRCVLSQNAGNGLELNALAGEGFVVSDIEVRNCDIADNLGYGVFANHVSGAWLVLNRIRWNDLKGIRIAAMSRDLAIGQNTFTNNSLGTFTNPDPSPPCAVITGEAGSCTGRHVEVVPGAIAISVNENTYCHRDADINCT
jgi:polygalacturonase